ncbi:MAG: hypothetical protein N2167_07315 [Flavobacteriales bacterium]|nr:hypothetical protein [Flavobacteriales bacterium]
MLLSRFSLFKTPKPRTFEYKPLYYRPEEDTDMITSNSSPDGKQPETYVPGHSIRRQMQERWNRNAYHTRYENSRRKVFTLLVAMLLAALIWFML